MEVLFISAAGFSLTLLYSCFYSKCYARC